MIKGVGIFVLMIFLFSGISASCNETQIDINTANLTELDKIIGIGPTYAERIIQERPFGSVDDLIRVSGIGNKTLDKIKQQGFACVSEETQTKENLSEETDETYEEKTTSNTSNVKSGSQISSNNPFKKITLEAIDLNSKDIKSGEDKEILKKNLALGGIITFCIGFGILFLLKFARKRKENEFG